MTAPPSESGTRLQGKLALVTGSGAGIGQACALLFARQGATVLACDIDSEASAATMAQALSEKLCFYNESCDLADPDSVRRLVTRADAQLGGLDIVVNAAAWGAFNPIEAMDYENDWRRTLTNELDIVFLACKAAWPLLRRRGGSIVNFASANAWQVLKGSGALAHCAGKGGVLAMTRQLAMEGAPHGIRANTISPGMVLTAATRPVLDSEDFHGRVLAKHMIGRLGNPIDIAWCALYLASDEASWVTAADFTIDGGATKW